MKPSYYLGAVALLTAFPVFVHGQGAVSPASAKQPPARLPAVSPPDLTPQPLPLPLPAPTPLAPKAPPPITAAAGRFALLRDDRLLEGTVFSEADKVIVRRGVLDTPVPREDVAFIGQTKDDVYRYRRTLLNESNVEARLKLAKWCVFSGLREQALAEARAIVRLEPTNAAAVQLVRSLEESLKKFPPPGTPQAPVTIPPSSVMPTAVVPDPEPMIALEATVAFRTRVQPILTNLCADCHGRADMTVFKLARVAEYDPSPSALKQNVRAVLAQIRKDDPDASPLLVKAFAQHGGMRQPAFPSPKAQAFQTLVNWVHAVSPAPVPPVATGVDPIPALPADVISKPVPPEVPVPSALEPAPSLPRLPAPNAMPGLPAPTPVPPGLSAPRMPLPNPPLPNLPTMPPVDRGFRSAPSAMPSLPPAIPASPVLPHAFPVAVPAPPPVTLPPVPPPTDLSRAGKNPVRPAVAISFAADVKLPEPTGPSPTNAGEPVDEFDPSLFNRVAHPDKVKK